MTFLHGVTLASRFMETVVSIKLSLHSRKLQSDLQSNKSKSFTQYKFTILNLMIHANIYAITDSCRYSHHSTLWKYDPEISLAPYVIKPALPLPYFFFWSFVPGPGPPMKSRKHLERPLKD